MIRTRWAWAVGLGAALSVSAAAVPAAWASELVTAETDFVANDVTVQQGASAPFTIKVSATGNDACGSTATAQVDTSFAFDAAAALSAGTMSAPLNFSAPGSGSNCSVTWTGAPTPYSVSAQVSAAATTPLGNYQITLSDAANTTQFTNSNSTGGKLGDTTATVITVHVVAPPDPCAGAVTPAAPTFSGSPDGQNGWYVSTPTVNASSATGGAAIKYATDPAGPFASSAPNVSDGQTTVYAEAVTSCKTSAATSNTYKVDTQAPSVADNGPTPASPDGNNGWYIHPVGEQFTASDPTPGSGLSGSNPFTVSSGNAEGASVVISSGSVSDVAGNTGQSVDSNGYKIDLSDPTNVAFTGSGVVQDGGSYFFGSVPGAPSCTADDAVSGLASCNVTGYGTSVGSHSLTATATDNAGRNATATGSYTVNPWTINGFYQPVDMSGIYNVAKAGSTIPLKFNVFAGSTEITDTSAVTSLTSTKVVCSSGAPTDAIETYATGGTSLRYDSTAKQFVYNMATAKSLAGSCTRTTLTTQDGSTISALFMLK